MPRLDSWDEFSEKVKSMYHSDPVTSRLTVKYRHNDGKLNVKVTNNRQVFQYLAEQPKELKNVDKLMSIIMESMTSH